MNKKKFLESYDSLDECTKKDYIGKMFEKYKGKYIPQESIEFLKEHLPKNQRHLQAAIMLLRRFQLPLDDYKTLMLPNNNLITGDAFGNTMASPPTPPASIKYFVNDKKMTSLWKKAIVATGRDNLDTPLPTLDARKYGKFDNLDYTVLYLEFCNLVTNEGAWHLGNPTELTEHRRATYRIPHTKLANLFLENIQDSPTIDELTKRISDLIAEDNDLKVSNGYERSDPREFTERDRAKYNFISDEDTKWYTPLIAHVNTNLKMKNGDMARFSIDIVGGLDANWDGENRNKRTITRAYCDYQTDIETGTIIAEKYARDYRIHGIVRHLRDITTVEDMETLFKNEGFTVY